MHQNAPLSAPVPRFRFHAALCASAALLASPLVLGAITFDLDPASPSGGTDVNAFSYSGAFTAIDRVNFSVDRLAVGVVGSGVFRQARPGVEEAHGDVFHSSPRGNNESIDEQQLGLVPGFFGDDLDALDLRAPTADTFFSIDFLSASNGFGATALANDIFLNSLASTFASGELHIGLSANDDIDALNLFDGGITGSLDPGLDYAVFSLNSFSPTLGAGGFAPGDLLYTEFDGTFSLWRSAVSLGLAPGDELNAVSIPEPGSLALLLLSGLVACRRRRTVA